MKVPHYDKALVPEHLTKQTIEMLPLDKPYYVNPGEREDRNAPAVFVMPDRRLVMSRSHALDIDDAYPYCPLELVGVMHVAVMDPEKMSMRDAYVADLRFIAENALVDIDPSNINISKQDEYTAILNLIADSVTFDAFITPENGVEIDDGVVPGTFYGNQKLYPYLKKLRKRGNNIMKRFVAREAKGNNMPPDYDSHKPAAKAGTTEKPKQTSYLDNPLSNRQ